MLDLPILLWMIGIGKQVLDIQDAAGVLKELRSEFDMLLKSSSTESPETKAHCVTNALPTV